MAEDIAKKTVDDGAKDVEKNKTMAILAWIIFFIPLLTDAKDSKFAKFHANQSLVVTLLGIAGSILTSTLVGAIVGIPLSIAAFVFWLMGIIGASQGTMKKTPLIGGIEIIK